MSDPGRVDEVIDVPQDSRYEVRRDGELAGFASYTDRPGLRYFVHTEVFDRFAGQGLAGTLAAGALADTRSAGLRVVPLCPFIAGYLRKHPEFEDIVDWHLARP